MGKTIDMEIIKYENPYLLDRAVYKEKAIDVPALTKKNSLFIEAIVRLDSNYNLDSDETKNNDDGFDPILNVSSANGRFCGSSKYWLTLIKNSKSFEEYRRAVYGAVVSIDTFNSTHLEATLDGRKKMAEIIISNYPSFEELKEALVRPFNKNDSKHIISKLSIPLEARRKGTARCNLSFASKFCSYASLCLLDEDHYSKYDSVVSDMLPFYMELYLGKKLRKNYYKVKASTHEEWLRVYEIYSNDIGEILSLEDIKNNEITREKFDHIIWYSNK